MNFFRVNSLCSAFLLLLIMQPFYNYPAVFGYPVIDLSLGFAFLASTIISLYFAVIQNDLDWKSSYKKNAK